MFRYFYLICTQSNRNKYWTRKNIYLNDQLYTYNDNRYSLHQINRLINFLNESDYDKINDNKLPINNLILS